MKFKNKVDVRKARRRRSLAGRSGGLGKVCGGVCKACGGLCKTGGGMCKGLKSDYSIGMDQIERSRLTWGERSGEEWMCGCKKGGGHNIVNEDGQFFLNFNWLMYLTCGLPAP